MNTMDASVCLVVLTFECARACRLPRVPESLLKKRKTADKIAAERAAKAIEDKKVPIPFHGR